MQSPLPMRSLIDESGRSKDTIARLTNYIKTLDELLTHYKIDKSDSGRYFLLSLHLAFAYVPAMHFQKSRGAKKKWGFDDQLALYALIEFRKKIDPRKPIMSVKHENSICHEVKELSKGSKLYELVKNIEPKKIEEYYLKFKKSEGLKLILKILPESIEVLAAITIYSPDYSDLSKGANSQK